jgi:ferredoxin
MRIHVDTNKCSGHAQCAAVSPDFYDLDDLGYAVPRDEEVEPGDVAAARAGADACPERAITLES